MTRTLPLTQTYVVKSSLLELMQSSVHLGGSSEGGGTV